MARSEAKGRRGSPQATQPARFKPPPDLSPAGLGHLPHYVGEGARNGRPAAPSGFLSLRERWPAAKRRVGEGHHKPHNPLARTPSDLSPTGFAYLPLKGEELTPQTAPSDLSPAGFAHLPHYVGEGARNGLLLALSRLEETGEVPSKARRRGLRTSSPSGRGGPQRSEGSERVTTSNTTGPLTGQPPPAPRSARAHLPHCVVGEGEGRKHFQFVSWVDDVLDPAGTGGR